VVTTSDWITGQHRDQYHPHPSGQSTIGLIEAACQRGQATFYGTGMNPGLAQILGIVNTAGLARVDHVTVLESVDVSCHHSVETWKKVGYGRPADDPEVPWMLEKGCTVHIDALQMMADCFDLKLDEVAFECELGACTEEVDLGWWRLPRGSVGASFARFKGLVGGETRLEAHLEWQMTPLTEPRWQVQNCYVITIRGNPQIVNTHMIVPEENAGKDWSDPGYIASIGMTITGMPALNAIGAVCAARPGIITSADLPLRAFASRFHLPA
jgi:4-hydroxy-tetrahydrodipicolinate reductase